MASIDMEPSLPAGSSRPSRTRATTPVPLFKVRDSPFTEAMRDPNHQATFSLFLAFQSIFAVSTLAYYAFYHRQLWSDLNLFVRMFSPIEASILLETICTIAFLILLPAARVNGSFPGSVVLYFLLVTFSLSVIIIAPGILEIHFNTHPVLSCALCMQQIRFLMKVISFLIEERKLRHPQGDPNVKGDIESSSDMSEGNHNHNNNKIEIPAGAGQDLKSERATCKSMLYFLFAPTLIYRHSYPRYPNPTNWLMVLAYFLQWLLLFFPMTLLANHQLLPLWSKIGRQPLTPSILYQMFLWTTAASALFWLGIGYCFLHCWLNMWAEVLRFGDRLFYKNWWSCRNGLAVWSLWNYMISLWISKYIFIPCIKLTKSRIISILVTFCISAFVHDYLISFAMGCFFPYLVSVVIFLIIPATPIFLTLSYLLKFIPLPTTNVHVFVTALLSITIGMMAAAFEYNSRQACPVPVHGSSFNDVLIPRSFYCITLSFDFTME